MRAADGHCSTKMEARAITVIAAGLVLFAAMLVLAGRREEPIQVSGGLTDREVKDICSAVSHKMAPPVLPDLSMKSICAVPSVIRERFRRPRPRIWKVERRNDVFVGVTVRSPRDATPRPYAFWSVFKGTNGWNAENEYYYP